MKFIKSPIENTIPVIVKSLVHALETHTDVVWLVCGGSNIRIQTKVMEKLNEKYPELLDSLTIIPMDERYGMEGHADSNYKQMLEAGFDAGEAHWFDILVNDLPLAETVEYYEDLVDDTFAEAQFVVGTFGMGADGHTAGILPNSPAVLDNAANVVGYQAPGFTRLTLTPHILTRCNQAFVLAYGTEKATALHNLFDNKLSLQQMPAKLHYEIENVTVYNDVITSEEYS